VGETHCVERLTSRTAEGEETWVPFGGSNGSEEFAKGFLAALTCHTIPELSSLYRVSEKVEA